MSDALWVIEAAITQGEQTNPVAATVVFVVGVSLFAITTIGRWRQRRDDKEPQLQSFLDEAPQPVDSAGRHQSARSTPRSGALMSPVAGVPSASP